MNNEEAIKALKRFIEQVDRLRKSSFYEYYEKHRRVAVTVEVTKGSGASITTFFPDEDSINGFLMPLRLLIQDSDGCSFRALSKIIPTLPVSDELKLSFKKERDELNFNLNRNTRFIVDNEEVLTRRRIFEVILYGYIAHVNPEYRRVYDHWMSFQIFDKFIMGEFVSIILDIGDLAQRLANTTIKDIIDELKTPQ